MKLYEIVDAIKEVEKLMENDQIDKETIKDTLDALNVSLDEKVDSICKLVRNFEASGNAKEIEAKRLKEEAQKDYRKADQLKDYLAYTLQRLDIKKMETNLFKVGFRKGRERIEVDESKLPADYFVQKYVPLSKTELKAFLDKGKDIPGVQVVRSPDSLVIK